MNLKQQLLNELTSNPVTAYDLSTKLNYNSHTVKCVLRELVIENKVEIVKFKLNTRGGERSCLRLILQSSK